MLTLERALIVREGKEENSHGLFGKLQCGFSWKYVQADGRIATLTRYSFERSDAGILYAG